MNAALLASVLNMVQAGFAFLQERGMNRDRIQRILDDFQDGDIPDDVLDAELDALDAELDDTDAMLGNN